MTWGKKTKRAIAKKAHVDTRRRSVHVKRERGYTASPEAVRAARALDRRSR